MLAVAIRQAPWPIDCRHGRARNSRPSAGPVPVHTTWTSSANSSVVTATCMLHSPCQRPTASAMRPRHHSWAAWGGLVLLTASAFVSAQQPPTFKSSVDLVTSGRDGRRRSRGRPVDNLDSRRVRGARQRHRATRRGTALSRAGFAHKANASGAATSSSAEPSAGGRIIVVAVDEESLPKTDSARPLMQTIAAWIDRLTPADRMSIVALPPPGLRQKLTSDKAALTRTIYKLRARAPAVPARLGLNGYRRQPREHRLTTTRRTCWRQPDISGPRGLRHCQRTGDAAGRP